MKTKYILVTMFLLFAFTGCVVTVKNVETEETKSFVEEMKEKYIGLNSCQFSSRSGHSFSIEYVFAAETDEKISDTVIEDTVNFLNNHVDVIVGSEIGIHLTFTDELEVLFNLEDIDEPRKWTYFE